MTLNGDSDIEDGSPDAAMDRLDILLFFLIKVMRTNAPWTPKINYGLNPGVICYSRKVESG